MCNMKRYLIILVLSIALVGCSSAQAKAPAEAAVEVPAASVQDNSAESASNTVEATEVGSLDNNQPAVEQGSNLELPSGFPSNIVTIVEGANITGTFVDGEAFVISYQTNKSFEEVKKIYERLMDGSKPIMEASQADGYYTVNGTKDKINIFITVEKISPDITSVAISTNTLDFAMLEQAGKSGEGSGSMPDAEDSGQ
jgi:hypothetical protein